MREIENYLTSYIGYYITSVSQDEQKLLLEMIFERQAK